MHREFCIQPGNSRLYRVMRCIARCWDTLSWSRNNGLATTTPQNDCPDRCRSTGIQSQLSSYPWLRLGCEAGIASAYSGTGGQGETRCGLFSGGGSSQECMPRCAESDPRALRTTV